MSSLKELLSTRRHLPHIDLTKLVLLSAVLIVAFSVFYYLVIFIPEKERMKVEWEKEAARAEAAKEASEESTRQGMLTACLQDADISYRASWDRDCENLGRGEDCALPMSIADSVNKIHRENQDSCYKRYPAK